MTASTLPLFTQTPQLRPLNILRDLPVVADLVELCFGKTLDVEGRSFISQMRKAGHDNAFMRWAVSAVETVSMPLSGFVWEEEGKIIGNVSLIPFSSGGQKIYLIANVVVHPEHRRRGIGRSLTSAAMQLADQKGASAIWLHARPIGPIGCPWHRHPPRLPRRRGIFRSGTWCSAMHWCPGPVCGLSRHRATVWA